MAAPKSELQRFLEGTEITVEDVRSEVALLAATAKGQSNVVVGKLGTGGGAALMPPLSNSDDVRQIEKWLESVEARLQETNEKLDKVLAALSAKSQDKVLGFAGDANSSRFMAFAACRVVAGLLHDPRPFLAAGLGRGCGGVRRPRGGPVRHPPVSG
jgi:hypothetical protein